VQQENGVKGGLLLGGIASDSMKQAYNWTRQQLRLAQRMIFLLQIRVCLKTDS
jgi:hypothetical protein